ncbi:MAG: hypothetical protein ACD_58C00287G0014 [uncultured bacterium]|nr:MAG: hypothetical protein ACD_58C00287G0014 [uncultured bacterium]
MFVDLWYNVLVRLIKCLTILLITIFPSISRAVFVNTYYKTNADGKVTQTINLSSSQQIPLSFSWCNPLTCGNPDHPDLGCILDLYMPQFINSFDYELKVNAFPGAIPEKIYLKSGPIFGVTSNYGQFTNDIQNDWNKSILKEKPTINNDNSITLKFKTYPTNFGFRYSSIIPNMVCGLNNQEYEAFKNKYGITYNNFYNATQKIVVVWKATKYGVYNQEIDLNGSPITVNAIADQPEDITKSSKRSIKFSYNKNYDEITNLSTNILLSSGKDVKQKDEQTNLTNAGVISNDSVSYKNFISYLNNQKILISEVNATDAIMSVIEKKPIWVVYSEAGTNNSVVAKITNYNAKNDSFKIQYINGNKANVPWNTLLKGQPWFLKTM